MIVHRPELDGWQSDGTALAVQISRLFSTALGLGTVVITYVLARTAFPERPLVAITAAALNAFLPMFLFISGSVNNDNLSNLLGNLITWLIVIALTARQRPSWRLYLLIGIAVGAGLLSKLNIGFLIPVVVFTFIVLCFRFRTLAPLLMGGVISGGLTIAIAGWWYLRNFQLYGDPTGLNVFLDIVGRRAIPANAAHLWAERHSFAQAFWGFFGGVNVPMPEWVYVVFSAIGVGGLLSAVAFLVVQVTRRSWSSEQWLAAGVLIIWPVATFLSYLRWTAETPASQGRLLFGALSPILIWIALGWTWWLPARFQPISAGAVTIWFAAVAVAAPFTVIAPAYARPALTASDQPITETSTFLAADGGSIALLNGNVRETSVIPGSYVTIDTTWMIVEPVQRDWSLFVHLVTPDDVIIAQRDIYPGGGRLATSDIAAGLRWDNPVAIFVPETAFTPTTLDVRLGWYHLPTGERMELTNGEQMISIGSLELRSRASDLDVPNPVSVNFDNQIELVGYTVSDISPAAGSIFTVDLYWRGLRAVPHDYVVFVHLIDPATQTIYAGS
ncbi:MAG: glycosyltransferase family 39 protein, partial [Anaerolinea sp.]|nr:glycosyltransferase family 39 protein [Anaerolinea sp.]